MSAQVSTGCNSSGQLRSPLLFTKLSGLDDWFRDDRSQHSSTKTLAGVRTTTANAQTRPLQSSTADNN